MAHELSIDGGRAAMFYVGEKPWHRLGTQLEAPPSSEAAIAAAGLDWTVTKVPLYVAAQARLHELRKRFAIVPTDRLGSSDFPVFGIVGPDYVPLQNSEAFAFFAPIVKDGHATYETAGALGHGECIWIQARLGNDIEVAGDKIQRYLLLSNTHNASSRLQVKLTPVRVVCNNTLTVALSVRGTLWAAYNGVTELIDHRKPNLRGPDFSSRRLHSVWFGAGAMVKQRPANCGGLDSYERPVNGMRSLCQKSSRHEL